MVLHLKLWFCVDFHTYYYVVSPQSSGTKQWTIWIIKWRKHIHDSIYLRNHALTHFAYAVALNHVHLLPIELRDYFRNMMAAVMFYVICNANDTKCKQMDWYECLLLHCNWMHKSLPFEWTIRDWAHEIRYSPYLSFIPCIQISVFIMALCFCHTCTRVAMMLLLRCDTGEIS